MFGTRPISAEGIVAQADVSRANRPAGRSIFVLWYYITIYILRKGAYARL